MIGVSLNRSVEPKFDLMRCRMVKYVLVLDVLIIDTMADDVAAHVDQLCYHVPNILHAQGSVSGSIAEQVLRQELY